ncbi:cytochrome P450 [Actinomadura sp. 7K507]|uniref:cytochrome P450 n=1 Tax=Actinomadura sp. 7K507 TaxID=2530365 RepID=UPI00105037AF|nr:cytochrome P450 [Actinomadura sp. 7K507]TDC86603.1 cytochrome P450 [Actinomadura sp. 7K507]
MRGGDVTGLADIDLSQGGFWAAPYTERAAAFEVLRRERPFAFFEEPHVPWARHGPGFYAVTRYADVVEASRRPGDFSNAEGIMVFERPPESVEFFDSMINMDDPRHARLRRIVSRAFTPGMIAQLEEQIRQVAAEIVDELLERGPCDFVTEVAERLPLTIICRMMGLPESRHRFVAERTNIILGAGDSEYTPEENPAVTILTAAAELSGLVKELAAERIENPAGDLASKLVNANIDGESLTPRELGSFFGILLQAGNETTRTAISHGLVLLTEHPDQKRLWAGDFERYAATATEEIVRVASPIIYMRRTATRDCELNGRRFGKGDKLLLYYWSANRDETVFDAPDRFDITRSPNPHLGFGAPGPHYCLGAHLARSEITAIFRELLARAPGVHAAGKPDRLRSNFLNGIKHLPCSV